MSIPKIVFSYVNKSFLLIGHSWPTEYFRNTLDEVPKTKTIKRWFSGNYLDEKQTNIVSNRKNNDAKYQRTSRDSPVIEQAGKFRTERIMKNLVRHTQEILLPDHALFFQGQTAIA